MPNEPEMILVNTPFADEDAIPAVGFSAGVTGWFGQAALMLVMQVEDENGEVGIIPFVMSPENIQDVLASLEAAQLDWSAYLLANE